MRCFTDKSLPRSHKRGLGCVQMQGQVFAEGVDGRQDVPRTWPCEIRHNRIAFARPTCRLRTATPTRNPVFWCRGVLNKAKDGANDYRR